MDAAAWTVVGAAIAILVAIGASFRGLRDEMRTEMRAQGTRIDARGKSLSEISQLRKRMAHLEGLTKRLNHDVQIPEGTTFLDLTRDREDECAAKSEECIVTLGKKAPRCYDQIGTILALTDAMASCFWGCGGGNHNIERLCGRVVSNGYAAIRLMKAGFYDETLSLCRSMGEVANLMWLFVHQQDALTDWQTLTDREHRKRFGPVKVRETLEKLQKGVPIRQERYKPLSSQIVHPHPRVSPQAYNMLTIPTLGGVLQPAGVMICINEIAYPLTFTAVGSALLLNLDTDIRQRVFDAAMTLAESLGEAKYAEWENFRRESQIEAFGVEVRGPRDLPREP